jgi:hypothetical protein
MGLSMLFFSDPLCNSCAKRNSSGISFRLVQLYFRGLRSLSDFSSFGHFIPRAAEDQDHFIALQSDLVLENR